MATIKTLLDKYKQRFEEVAATMDEIERQEADVTRKGPVHIPDFIKPNYVCEVIHPILKMLAEALPQYPVHVPPAKCCKQEAGYYKIRVGSAVLGGLSHPTREDHSLFFTSLFKKRALEKIEIHSMEELIDQVKIELNKRGMLLPQDINQDNYER